MNLANLLKLLLVAAEEIVPIFIHNPQSQKVEAVILSTANAVVSALPAVNLAQASTGNPITIVGTVTSGTSGGTA